MQVSLRRAAKAGFVATLAAVGLSVLAAPAAFASTAAAGSATIVDPSTNNPLTTPQASSKQFALKLNGGLAANCAGSTASNGYHVFSFLVPDGTDPASVNFATGAPSIGKGYYTEFAAYVGPLNTSTSGQIVGVPNDLLWTGGFDAGAFDEATLDGGSSKTWDAGLACVDGTGVVNSFYNEKVTFTHSTTDAAAFTWQPTFPSTDTPEVPMSILLPAGGLTLLAGAYFVNRRRQAGKAVTSAA